MRAIDGDALKRKAQEVAVESWKMKIKANVETILNQFIDWIDAAPTIESERKWIPCSERLPESLDFVLLTVRRDKPYNQRPFISVGYIDMNKTSWWCAHDGNCKSANVEVIAWQPLPEPYRG